MEKPDYWLSRGNPWEIERADVTYPVRFYGYIKKYKEGGVERAQWEGGEMVLAQAYAYLQFQASTPSTQTT